MEEIRFIRTLFEELKDGLAINFVEGLFSRAYAIIEVGPAESVPLPAVHDREASQAGIRVAAQHGGERRFRKLAVGTFRKHSHAGGSAHQPEERAWVGSNRGSELVSRFRPVLDEIGHPQARQAG